MISLPGDKDSQAQKLTEVLKKQAEEISQGLDKVFGPLPQVEETPQNNSQVTVPKRLKDKVRLAEQLYQEAGRVTLKANWFTRVYSRMYRKTAHAGTK